jgi:hypothetical protein
MSALSRFVNLFRSKALQRDLDADVQFHLYASPVEATGVLQNLVATLPVPTRRITGIGDVAYLVAPSAAPRRADAGISTGGDCTSSGWPAVKEHQ